MENYVHHSWCHDIQQDPAFRKVAVDSLRKMGVPDPELLEPQQVCERLGELTCQMSRANTDECARELRNVPAEGRIALRCGGKVQCWDILDLKNKLAREPQFAARLSSTQLHRIDRLWTGVQKKTVLPCHALSGNADACAKQDDDRCAYHSRGLLKSLFSSAVRRYSDKECHMTAEFLRRSMDQCEKLPLKVLHAVADDIYFDYLERRMVEMDQMSLYERHMFAQDMEFMFDELSKSARAMDHAQLCALMGAFKEFEGNANPAWDTIVRILELTVAKLNLLNRYVTFEVLWKLAQWLKVKATETMIKGLAIMLNLALFVYENLFVSWFYWLACYPAGREYIKKAIKDPSFAVLFLLAFKFTGLSDPFLPQIEKMDLVIPYAESIPFLQVAAEQTGKAAVQNGLTSVINRDNFEAALATLAKRARKALKINISPRK